MTDFFDVIIAGAGPVGLFLACELALANVSVLIIEREVNPDSPWKDGSGLGRRGLFAPSIEAFYRRGLLGGLFDLSKRPNNYERTPGFQFAGHYAGIMLDGNKIDLSRWKYVLPGPAFSPGPSSIADMETVLSKRAHELGVTIIRGAAVSDIQDEGDSVKVWSGDRTFTARWLVGCDGGRSTIRKKAGFEFVGTEAEFTGYATLCDLDRPEILKRGFHITKSGMYIAVGNGTYYALDYNMEFDRTQDITKEHFQTVLRRVSGTDISVTALHLAGSFTDRCRQATQYRKGQVILAGDSAHIHSPLGAQGVNTGIGDALNLGWKLAATIKGHASPGLLDTYHQERHPVGASVLDWTRAQAATVRPDAHGYALVNMMRDMVSTEEGTTWFASRVWGLSRHYNLGDEHPLVGRSAPDFEFDDGTRLGPKLERGQFLIVDFADEPSVAEVAKPLQPIVDYFTSRAKETFGLRALLIRPDGTVAWIATESVHLKALKAALSRWLSHPTLNLPQTESTDQ